MIKRIKDMTVFDKGIYLEKVKKSYFEQYGTPWDVIEAKILAEIDATFNDEGYEKMKKENPDFALDAKFARQYFDWENKHKKPSLVDYLLWSGQFVTKSDLVEF